jgi:hypothetical protein
MYFVGEGIINTVKYSRQCSKTNSMIFYIDITYIYTLKSAFFFHAKWLFTLIFNQQKMREIFYLSKQFYLHKKRLY